MSDYLELYSAGKGAKFVTSTLVRDRRVCLYGIDVEFVQDGNSFHMDPVIPCAGPLMDLIKSGSGVTFRFNRKYKKWTQIIPKE